MSQPRRQRAKRPPRKIHVAPPPIAATPQIRVVMPDSAVTQDFRADRLNVIVDASGNITALECY